MYSSVVGDVFFVEWLPVFFCRVHRFVGYIYIFVCVFSFFYFLYPLSCTGLTGMLGVKGYILTLWCWDIGAKVLLWSTDGRARCEVKQVQEFVLVCPEVLYTPMSLVCGLVAFMSQDTALVELRFFSILWLNLWFEWIGHTCIFLMAYIIVMLWFARVFLGGFTLFCREGEMVVSQWRRFGY